MKKVLLLIVALALMQAGMVIGQDKSGNPSLDYSDAVTVAAVPETEDLAGIWINGYLRDNPEREIKLLPASESGRADLRISSATSADIASMKQEWKIVVARDILIPVTGTSNPLLESIFSKGIDPSEFGAILTSNGSLTWASLTDNGSSVPVKIAIPSDEAAITALARFAGVDAGLITAHRLSSPSEIATLLNNNQGMIIFCRLAALTAEDANSIPDGIAIIPVDVNANGISDHFEQFYGDYNSFNRGVYIGKYPKELCSTIFCSAPEKPAAGAQAEFVRWLLSGGQELIAGAGYTALSGGEGMIRREMLASEAELLPAVDHRMTGTGSWVWIAGVIAAASLIAFGLYRITGSRVHKIVPEEEPVHLRSFNPDNVTAPAGILYGKSHTWAFMEKNGAITLGMDDFLQHITGTISRISLRSPGEKVRRGEPLASVIQRGKQLEILSPVSGTIISRNERLINDTGILHSSPYAEGWLYGIEPDNWLNESRLLTAASRYTEQIREEFGRIRDFLASFPGSNDLRLAHVILQDGGELKEGLLEEFGPEIWEEFQSRFLD